MMKNVFIWTDIGTNPDDILAVLMAVRSKSMKVVGFSTCFDSTGSRARLLETILRLEDRSFIPVKIGKKPFHVSAEKERKYLGPVFTAGKTFPEGLSLLDASHSPLDVMTLGPLSDLGVLLRQSSSWPKKILSWTAMGGAVSGEEYNFTSDPEATATVVRSPFPKRIIPLDLTRRFFINEDCLGKMNLPEGLGRLLLDQWKAWKEMSGRDHFYLNDPLAVAAYIDPKLFTFRKAKLFLIQDEGKWQTRIDFDDCSELEVAVDVDRESFFRIFFELLG